MTSVVMFVCAEMGMMQFFYRYGKERLDDKAQNRFFVL